MPRLAAARRALLKFGLVYGLCLLLWTVLLPGYSGTLATVAERLLPLLEHPRLTKSLGVVRSQGPGLTRVGIEVTSPALKADGPLLTISAGNSFSNLPAAVAILLVLPQMVGRRSRAVLRCAAWVFLAHLALLQVRLYHLYAIEVRETRQAVFGDVEQFLIRGAYVLLFTVGSEAVVALAGMLACLAAAVDSPVPTGRRGRPSRHWVPRELPLLAGGLALCLIISSLVEDKLDRAFTAMADDSPAPSAFILFKAGREALEAGDEAGARSYFERVVEKDSRHAEAYLHLASLLAQREEWPGAGRHLDRALEIDPRNAVALGNRGAVRIRLGRVAEAERDLRQSLDLAPGLAASRQTLSSLLRWQGRDEEARQVLNPPSAPGP